MRINGNLDNRNRVPRSYYLGSTALILWIYGVDGGVCPEGVTGAECTYKVVW